MTKARSTGLASFCPDGIYRGTPWYIPGWQKYLSPLVSAIYGRNLHFIPNFQEFIVFDVEYTAKKQL